MPISVHYTVEEWREISDGASFDAVGDEQVWRLHRHWIWADHARREFENALSAEGWDDVTQFARRVPWAMYMWYGLLWALIEGYTSRQIKICGQLREDIRPLRDPLRTARHAAFHVDRDFDYYDPRFVDIVRRDATEIIRVHKTLGQLLLDELRRRGLVKQPST